MASLDLFLSYHRRDRESVEKVRQILNAQGVSTFYDRENLVPGLPWPQALEQALRIVRAVAVFVGPELGSWQKREIYFALDRQAEEEGAGRRFPVIPVLLPQADLTSSFLFLNTWVDLQGDLTSADAITLLLKAIHGDTVPKVDDRGAGLCPYRGLNAFREEHAAFFCGREEFSRRLLEKILSENGLVSVIGPSGSGKSSIVLSGLLPLLRRQRPPAKAWDVVSFTPGDRPFYRLAASLIPLLEPELKEIDRLAEARKLGDHLAAGLTEIADVAERIIERSKGTDRLLVVIDQFEEIITLAADKDRSSFVESMFAALGHAPVEFVLILRADYYGHAIGLSRALSDRMEQSVVNVGSMTRNEIEGAIVKPAKKVGLDFEPGLVHRLLEDLGQEPGQLPLLEFALTELWTRRRGRLMTHAAYEEFGGLRKAISHSAHAELAKCNPEQQAAIRQIFTRLVRVRALGQGGEDTRQRVSLNELGTGTRPLVDRLANARLLVTARDEATGEETIEVSHEALIQGWSDLQVWLNEDREFLLWRQRLKLALTEWQRTKRDEGSLLRGALLTEAERWHNSRAGELNQEERDFIGLSIGRVEKEALEESHRRRRRMLSLAIGLLLMSALAGVAALQWRRAAGERRVAQAGRLLSSALLIKNTEPSKFDQAALLAIESLHLDDTAGAKAILRDAISQLPKEIGRFQIDCDGQAALSPGGRFSACLDRTGRSAKIISTADGKDVPHRPITEARGISIAQASPDGKFLGVALVSGGFKLFDIQTGNLVVSESNGSDQAMAFSANGSYFAAGVFGQDPGIHVLPLADGGVRSQFRIDYPVLALTLSPDGRFLAASHSGHPDTEVTIFDLTSKQSRTIHGGAAFPTLALSADATFIALPYLDNTVRVKDTSSNETEYGKLTHQKLAYAVALSEDRKYAASGSEDGTVRVMETGTGRPIALIPVGLSVRSVAFTSNNHLVLVSEDKVIRTVNVLKRPAFESLSVPGPIGISPRGRYMTTFTETPTSELAVIDRLTGKKQLRLPVSSQLVTTGVIRYSLDEKYLVTTGSAFGMTAYELETGKSHDKPAVPGLIAETISADGNTVGWATAQDIAIFSTWDNRQERLEFSNAHLLELSPDGKLVAVAGRDPILAVFEVATKKKLFDVQSGSRVTKALFSPDGRYLAIAFENKNLILSAVRTGNVLWQLKDADNALLVFSHDGRILATGGGGEGRSTFDIRFDVRLVETATGTTLFQIPKEAQPVGAAFSIDGRYLDIVDDTFITRHYLRAEDLIEQTCSLLTRNLRQDEWDMFMADSAYHRTCPNLPKP